MISRTTNSYSVREETGKRLRKAREEQKYSRNKLSNLLLESSKRPSDDGPLPDTIKQWEYGNNPISTDWIPSLCEVLHFEPSYLFGYTKYYYHEVTDICSCTGLSPSAIKALSILRDFGDMPIIDFDGSLLPIDVLSSLLSDSLFDNILANLALLSCDEAMKFLDVARETAMDQISDSPSIAAFSMLGVATPIEMLSSVIIAEFTEFVNHYTRDIASIRQSILKEKSHWTYLCEYY